MEAKEIAAIQRKLFEEFYKKEEVKNALKFSNQIYIFSIEEKGKHKIIILNYLTQLNYNTLKSYGFTKNAFVEKLYTLSRVRKICY